MSKVAFAVFGLAVATASGGLAYAGGGGGSGDINIKLQEEAFKTCNQARGSAEGAAEGVRFTQLQSDVPLSCRGVEQGHFGLVVALDEPLQQDQVLQIVPIRAMFKEGSAEEADSVQSFSMGMDVRVGEIMCGEGVGDTLVADLGESGGQFVSVGVTVSLEAGDQSTPFCDVDSCHGSYMICDGDMPVAWGSGKVATSVKPYTVYNIGESFTIMNLATSIFEQASVQGEGEQPQPSRKTLEAPEDGEDETGQE